MRITNTQFDLADAKVKTTPMDAAKHLVNGSMTDAAIDDRCERLEAGEKVLKTEAWCPLVPPPGFKKPCYHTCEEVITHLKD